MWAYGKRDRIKLHKKKISLMIKASKEGRVEHQSTIS
jgi:hypothetical protein